MTVGKGKLIEVVLPAGGDQQRVGTREVDSSRACSTLRRA